MRASSVLLSLWVLWTTPAASQSRQHWGELAIVGRISEISVSPSHRVWLTTALSTSYFADSIFGSWKYGPIQPADSSEFLLPHVDRISFFNRDTAIATGYIGEDAKNAYYRTRDGGASWDTLSLPSDLWVYDAQVTADGNAWLVGSSGDLLQSQDFGATWGTPIQPLRHRARTTTVHFMTPRDGLVGGFDNELAGTRDGGRTWQPIPTPLDQAAYDSTRYGDDHRISKVRMFGRWIVIGQVVGAFVSPRDSIAWRPIQPTVIDFEVDESGFLLYGITGDYAVITLDRDLVVRTASDRSLPTRPVHIMVRGRALYAVDALSAVHVVTNGWVESTYPLTDLHGIQSVDRVRFSASGVWGTSRTGVYRADSIGGAWRRLGHVPVAIRGFEPIDDRRILLWDGHGANLVFHDDGSTEHAVGLDSLDVVDVVHVNDALLAYGGMQYQTTQRIEVARTYFGGQFRGSRPNGFLARSDDGGHSWRVMHQWEGEGIAALGAGPDETLFLVSYLGSVRRLEASDAGYRSIDLIVATRETHDAVPYHEEPYGLYARSRSHLILSGWTHYLDRRTYESHDGGATWTGVPFATFPFVELHWMDGRVFGVSDDGVFEITGDGRSALYRTPEDSTRASDLSRTPDGQLLIRLCRRESANDLAAPSVEWRVVDVRNGRDQ